MPAKSKIFDNVELTRRVCELSEPADQTQLLRVSKSFFTTAASVVWESVEGVHHLIFLLPGVKCKARENKPDAKQISIPKDLTSLDRFQLYAPFIKRLEIYNKDTQRYWIPNWSGFMVHARNEPLLPNLKTLTLKASSAHNNQLMWIRSFLSPSLTEIRVIPSEDYTPFISYLEASTMFRYITDFCPNLRSLSFFPDSEDLGDHEKIANDPRSMIDFWDSALPRYVGRATELRRLTTTTELLKPENLKYLAKLPHLEHLSVSPTKYATNIKGLAPDGSFLALRILTLRSPSYSLFNEIWNLRCFIQLTKLELHLAPQVDSESDLSLLISDICKGSPHLTELYIDFDTLQKWEYLYVLSSEDLLLPMRKSPLRLIRFDGAELEWTPKVQKLVPMVWEQLKYLYLQDNKATANELYFFSRLPNLETLVLNLDLSESCPGLVRSASPVNHCLNQLQSYAKIQIAGDVTKIARWLLALWPELKSIVWGEDLSLYENESNLSFSCDLAKGLNGIISLLHEVNKTKLRVLEAYGPAALELFSDNL